MRLLLIIFINVEKKKKTFTYVGQAIFQESRKSKGLGSAFLLGTSNQITVQQAPFAAGTPNTVNSLNLGLTTTPPAAPFLSTFSVSPQRKLFAYHGYLYANLDALWCGLWFDAAFAVVNARHDLNCMQAFIYQPIADWSDKEKLEKEKEVIGFYLSAHPLAAYKKLLSLLNIQPFETVLKKLNVNNPTQEPIVIGAGLIKSKREIFTKKGDRMAFVMMEDMSSSAEIILFPSTFKKVESFLSAHHIFVVKGSLDATSPHKCKIKANEFVPIDLFFQEWPSITKISCQLTAPCTSETLSNLKTKLSAGNIPVEFIFHENNKLLRLTSKEKIKVDQEIFDWLEAQKN